ncbi:MAG: leucine-rich repeat domain-containing protein [Saprospiraceae bacterium]|nr:leucine-rich repeat domain-containing protein [Saprospiraceae bacterium]
MHTFFKILLFLTLLLVISTTKAQLLSQKELNKQPILSSLENIQIDEVYRLDLTELPVITKEDVKRFLQCKKLQELTISIDNWVELPQDLSVFEQLNRLEISTKNPVPLEETQQSNLIKLLGSLRHLDHFNSLSILQLSLKNTPKVSAQLCELKQLTVLRLKETNLENLPDCICRLTQLRQLYLSNNKLKTLPECLNQLENLDLLKLSFNQLKQLPSNWEGLDKLAILDLVSNDLIALPVSVGKLSNLLHLYVDYNQIKELPHSFVQLENLRNFSASHNQIRKLPLEIEKCRALKICHLDHNRLNDLPRGILDLKLDTLGLLYNDFSLEEKRSIEDIMPYASAISNEDWAIPTAPENLKNLSRYKNKNLRVSTLGEIYRAKKERDKRYIGRFRTAQIQDKYEQDTFYQAHHLQELYLETDSIGFPNIELDPFRNLQKLQVGYNRNQYYLDLLRMERHRKKQPKRKRFMHLPNQEENLANILGSLAKLEHFETLRITAIYLNEIPKEICEIKQLKHLYLIGLGLRKLPDCICELENLETIDLSYNGLSKLPDSIHQWQKLTILTLAYNKLQKLPESIGQLTQLKSIYLSENELSYLPPSIGNLKRLKIFGASNNRLQYLPEEFTNLDSLNTINLAYNYLKELPKEMGEFALLENLYLEANFLESLPRSMQNYKELDLFTLHSNAFSTKHVTRLKKVFPHAEIEDWRDQERREIQKMEEEEKRREEEKK